jgi:tetratricopeptide (TPR) repeat protein
MNKKNTAPVPKLSVSTSIFNFTFNVKCIIIAALAFGFYINTVNNEYALDDTLVINNNKYVQQGFSGISKILTTDTYDSYNQYMHGDGSQQLSGGRYRPLSVVIFAIEHQFFGETPGIRHLLSVVFFILCALSIFYFLHNFLLKKVAYGDDIAFLATALFVIHPLHTEVVANIKSLDEILSLTLIMLTFIFSLKYIENKKTLFLILGMLSFLIALLAKEYAATLLILLPLTFYLLEEEGLKESLLKSVPYIGVLVLYFIIRFASVGIPHAVHNDKILTNPYLYATPIQKIATELFVLGKYIVLLFYPAHLSADYSYAEIPYHSFSDISVWATILLYVGITVWGILLIIRKNILAFPVFFFLLNLALISNFVLDIGATMGERLIFHSSLGFTILIAFGLFKLTEKLQLAQKRQALAAVSIALTMLCFVKTIERNKEWKNDTTLFIADVKTAPNSFMTNGNAGTGFIKLSMEPENSSRAKGLLDTAMVYLHKSISIFHTYDVSYFNLGVCYMNLGDPDKAKLYWDTTRQITPTYPPLQGKGELLGRAFLTKGMQLAAQQKLPEALHELKEAVHSDNNNVDIWYNLGGAYYTLKEYDSARYCWNATLALKPDYAQAKQGLTALPKQIKDTVKGIR